MPESRLILPDEAATQALATRLAGRARPGDVLLLSGPLGAGKTSFARGFIRAIAGDRTLEIPSPTFTLLQTYETPAQQIAHYDLWRLTDHRAMEELGWDEAQNGIVLVEWPDRLGPLIPDGALHITISLIPEGREIKLTGEKRWFDASDTAVILSAGLGTRMRPLTLKTPKPLLPLEGQPILAHTLAHLRKAGVTKILVNAHHLAEQIAEFVAAYPEVTLSVEAELLETGGAITAMRSKNLLPEKPFYIVNGDAFWVDGPTDTLSRLAAAFDPEKMDAMLLLARAAGAVAETGMGDFLWPRGGPLKRREERDVAPYLFAGVQIVTPELFAGAPEPPFSMNVLWDRAMAAGRLDAIVHDGLWFHLSTPDDLARADAMLDAREVGSST